MLISDWNAAIFWDLMSVLEVQGVPSPTHSHQEQMAVAGLDD